MNLRSSINQDLPSREDRDKPIFWKIIKRWFFYLYANLLFLLKYFQGLLLLKIKNKNKILNTSTKPTKSSHRQPSNPTPLPLPEIPLFPHPQPCLIRGWAEAWVSQVSLLITHPQPRPNSPLVPIIRSHGAVDFPITALGIASISQLFV